MCAQLDSYPFKMPDAVRLAKWILGASWSAASVLNLGAGESGLWGLSEPFLNLLPPCGASKHESSWYLKLDFWEALFKSWRSLVWSSNPLPFRQNLQVLSSLTIVDHWVRDEMIYGEIISASPSHLDMSFLIFALMHRSYSVLGFFFLKEFVPYVAANLACVWE